MAARYPISYEDLMNNYEFKIMRKALMREFPWIKDVIVINPDGINDYNILFVDLLINPIMLQKEVHWPIMWYVPYTLERDGEIVGPFLSAFFKVDYHDAKYIVEDIEKLMESVHKSPALPNDLKIPHDRRFGIGVWKVTKDTMVTPEGYEPIYTSYIPTT